MTNNTSSKSKETIKNTNKDIIVVVNKLDNNKIENLYDFYELGFDVIPISAEQNNGILYNIFHLACAPFPKNLGTVIFSIRGTKMLPMMIA